MPTAAQVPHSPIPVAATLPLLAAVPTPTPRRRPAMYLAETPLPARPCAGPAYRVAPSRNKPAKHVPSVAAPPNKSATCASGAPTPKSSASLPATSSSSPLDACVHAPAVCATVGAAHDPNPNFRRTMEDELAVHVCDALPAAFVGVYDGHGGSTVAHYLRQLLHTLFLDELLTPAHHHHDIARAESGVAATAAAPSSCAADTPPASSDDDAASPPLDAPAAFRRSYSRMDGLLAERRCLRVGATAVTAFVSRRPSGARSLTVANCGDARAVLSRGGRAVRLTHDHRPTGTERARIEQAGGFVFSGRVNGVLNVARAFGDHCMKGLVVSTPSVVEMQIGPMDDFVVLACDGLWDVMDDAHAVETAQLCFDRGLEAHEVARELVKEAIARRSTDNVSVMVVQLHPDDEE